MRHDNRVLFPPTEEELEAARLTQDVNRGAQRLERTVRELAAELIVARKQIRELEEANVRLARELTQVRGHNARHLNEIQRIAIEKDRYAAVINMLGQPPVAG